MKEKRGRPKKEYKDDSFKKVQSEVKNENKCKRCNTILETGKNICPNCLAPTNWKN